MEHWKTIKGFENYQVSDQGRVRSVKTGNILKTHPNTHGYLIVSLGRKHKERIHRLVARAFLSGYFESAHVDHLNGVKTDNRSVNLQWVTPRENITRGGLSMKNPHKTSKYPGVCWAKHARKWRVTIVYKGKHYHLKYFHDESRAARLYEEAVEAIEENRFEEFIAMLRS